MSNEYFQSQEFKDLLASYEQGKREGKSVYLDAEDFADIGDYYINTDRCDLAKEAVAMGLGIHPDEEALLVVKSSAHIYMGEYDEAHKILSQLDSKNSDVMYQLAQLKYAKDNDTPAAEKIWHRWLALEDGSNTSPEQQRDAFLHIISSLVELRENALGFKEFDEEVVNRWLKEYKERFQPLGRYDEDVQLVDICRDADLPDQMAEVLAEVLVERPYMPKGWSSLALSQFVGQHYEQALESCGFALAIDDHDLDALLTKAHTLQAMGEKSMAKDIFKEYLEKGGESVQIIPYAEMLFNDGDTDEALFQLRKLNLDIEAKRLDAEEKLRAAEAVDVSQDDKDMAQQYYDNVLDAYDQVMSDMSDLYHRNQCYDESIAINRRALELDDHDADAYYMLGVNYLSKMDFKEAAQNFGNALLNSDDQVMMGVDIAATFLYNDYNDFALQVLNTIDEIASESDSPFVSHLSVIKSLTHLKLGNIEQFLKFFKEACEEAPNLVKHCYKVCIPKGIPFDQWLDYAGHHHDEMAEQMRNQMRMI